MSDLATASAAMDDRLPNEELEEGTITACARRVWQCSGSADPSFSLLCGSAHPAKLLGLTTKGKLTAGADADLVLLDPETLTVKACFIHGRLAYSHPALHGALWYH